MRPPYSRQQNHLLLGCIILLVNSHLSHELVNSAVFPRRQLSNPFVVEANGECVLGQALLQTTDCDAFQDAKVAGQLSLFNHAHSDTFAVQYLRREYSFNSMSNRMSKVQEVAKSALPLVRCHNVCFKADRSENDSPQDLLNAFETRCALTLICPDCIHNKVRVVLQCSKLCLLGYCGRFDDFCHAVR